MDKKHRGEGLSKALIQGAIEYVRENGGTIIESHPNQPKGEHLSPLESFMGTPQIFEQVGFVECARPSASKINMRYYIK
ncbi:MAG: hypothetical protein KAS38_01430 [Anaerolineales bacterium]|nr:hypothetical protein [Anaerolineales bacterium]